MYNIRCETWSGRLGDYKIGLLTQAGNLMSFKTQEAAQSKVDQLTSETNNGLGLSTIEFTVIPG